MTYATWLETPNLQRNLLVELDSRNPITTATETQYISVFDFVGPPIAGGNDVFFESRVSRETFIRKEINSIYGGVTKTSISDLTIINHDGRFDFLIDDDHDITAVRLRHGGPDLDLADYRIFDLFSDGLSVDKQNTLIISIQDSYKKLQVPVCRREESDIRLNAGDKIPVSIGKLFLIEPTLYAETPADVFFRIDDRTVFDPIEAMYLNGQLSGLNPVIVGAGFAIMKAQYNNEQIGVSVSGRSYFGLTEENTSRIGNILHYLLDREGIPIANTSTVGVNAARPYRYGVYEKSEKTVIDLCNEICEAENIIMTDDHNGRTNMRVMEFGAPVANFSDESIEEDSLNVLEPIKPLWKVRVGSRRRHSPQTFVDETVSASNKVLLGSEYDWITRQDVTVKENYSSAKEKSFETFLRDTTASVNEASRKLNFYKVQRYPYRFTSLQNVYQILVGDTISINHKRVESGATKEMIVTAIETSFIGTDSRIEGFG